MGASHTHTHTHWAHCLSSPLKVDSPKSFRPNTSALKLWWSESQGWWCGSERCRQAVGKCLHGEIIIMLGFLTQPLLGLFLPLCIPLHSLRVYGRKWFSFLFTLFRVVGLIVSTLYATPLLGFFKVRSCLLVFTSLSLSLPRISTR